MAGTSEMLRSILGEARYSMLLAVSGHGEPVSGRSIAAELSVSPTTASGRLSQLEAAGFASSQVVGRAKLWRLNTDSDVVQAWLRERRVAVSEVGSSPVSTGGGGVTLERKVAADYLGRLLLGHGAAGLGASRVVVSVAFQQAPEFAVDDLVVAAAEDGEDEPSLVLAVAVRRTPNLVQSDEKSQALFATFVQQLLSAPLDGPQLRLGLAAAGAQEHVEQLKVLAGIAAGQPDATGFFALLRTTGKFNQGVPGRLVQVEGLVRHALVDLGVPSPSADVIELRVWELLSRLVVLTPRMEAPDDSDWAALANSLIPAARGADLYGATQLRDRLLTLADDWAPKAASVRLATLRREAHDLLDPAVRRHQVGWRALELLDERARGAVREEIVSADGARRVRVDRASLAAELSAAVSSAAGVVVYGESGVGKSAAALGLQRATVPATDATTGAGTAAATARESQVVCVNLRHLPPTAVELEAVLGARLRDLLAEMSAPTRVLVVDGSDAVAEGAQDVLNYLVDAAAAAGVRVVAVTAGDAKQVVVDTLARRIPEAVVEVAVPSLTDPEVDLVVSEFAELEAMAANPQSRELLRRPVVVDLLVRGGVQGLPVSDFDAMQQVWEGLVYRNDPGRGTPDARNLVMLQLARQALHVGRDQIDVVATLDPGALEGLRKEGLLRTSQDNPFRPLPEFAHDEVRRYAVARLLLVDGDPTRVLIDAGVPRWALGAARLACQALLVAPVSSANPAANRFMVWQAKFDELVAAGFGERWTDVPGEALLTLGNPRPVLREAWPQLRSDDQSGLQQLIRLVDQRLRGQHALVRAVAVEPLVELLLEDETPWRSSKAERTLLQDWLRSLIASDVPAGYPLREQLRSRLLALCAAADERVREAEQERAAAEAAMTVEDRTAREGRMSLPIFGEIGYPRSRTRPPRPAISREITDETVIELLALLGPDLGLDGEALLRRVADADPRELAPAMEGVVCGRALSTYRRGFLAEMVLAYYIDEEEDGSRGFGHEDGVRDHEGFGLGLPLAAWYRGPFMPLFQSDFRNGVAVLNRILNHAATVRARTLTGLDGYFEPVNDPDLDRYSTELNITGAPHQYVGDSGTWNWYRGTGVGPYPCMSALQALERVCDNLIELDVPLDAIIPILLAGCDNVAMVALTVGVLVRHQEKSGTLLDPFLVESAVWHFEFTRVVHEHGGLHASSDGIVGSDRRGWSLRQAATSQVIAAGPERAEELRLAGEQLVERARRRLEQLEDTVAADAIEMELTTVRAWASAMDRSSYTMQKTAEGYLVQSHPPAEVATLLSAGMSEVMRTQEAMRLTWRYHMKQEDGTAEPITAEDLVADLQSAATLLDDLSELGPMGWDGPAAVAAYGLTQHLVHGLPLPDDSIKTAADIVLRIGEGDVPQRDHDIEESYFSQGADRSAARVLPLLLTPQADQVRHLLDGPDGTAGYARAEAAVGALSQTNVLQTRLFLARGLDRVWEVACTRNVTCPHQAALHTAIDMMRECVLGPWNAEQQERRIETLDDPIVDTLPAAAADTIYVSRLDAAIRALGPAAAAGICVSDEARCLLEVLLDAQRRALLTHDRGIDHRGSHSLVAARALLALSDEDLIFAHVDAYVDNSTVLEQALRAFSAAAEEHIGRADTARRIWPSLVERLIEAHDGGHALFQSEFQGRDYTLAALLPTPAGEISYLHSESTGKPIIWWDPVTWQATIERWLMVAGGKPTCVDSLVRFVASSLPAAQQASLGLPWVAQAVLVDPAAIASRCFNLTHWLVEIRTSADDAKLSGDWQRVVDALVVAGDTRLAAYSE